MMASLDSHQFSCVCVHVRAHAGVRLYVHACMCVRVHASAFVRLCVCVFVCVFELFLWWTLLDPGAPSSMVDVEPIDVRDLKCCNVG